MPSAEAIIDQLILASNRALAVPIGWHVLTAIALAALMLGWKVSKRAAGTMLAMPVASASVVAFSFRNPFNGSVLGALAITLVVLALRMHREPVGGVSPAAKIAGGALIAFGTFYPHFLAAGTPLAYLYAAPTGVVPCPTLSLVIGFALLGGGLVPSAWSVVLALVGIFYGVFGIARLRVYLDTPLMMGAAALLVMATAPRASSRARSRVLP